MILRRFRTQVRRGAAVVELAAVLPLIVIMLLGVWEIGRMLEMQQILDNAAREGARQASTGMIHADTTPPNDDVQAVVRLYLTEAFKSAGVPDPATAASNATVTFENLDQPTLKDPYFYVDGRSPNVVQGNRLKITVLVPLEKVRWVNLYLITNKNTLLQATIIWPSMADKPYQDPSDPPIE